MHRGWGRFVLVTALLSGVTTTLALVWVLSSRDTAAAAATVSAAVLTLAVPLLPWARQDMAVRPDQLAANLAAAALAQWQAEADKRQLRDPQPLTVRWSGADATLMDDPDVIAPEPMGQRHGLRHPALGARLSLTGAIDQVDEEFRKIPRRRLAVIGQPGAGKTGVLVMLTLKLLERWEPKEPVPILLTVSSWDPRREPLLDWLPRHLADEYSFLGRIGAQALVDRRLVLPVLDGLDELSEGSTAHALEAINRVGVEQPLVVACRTTEFGKAVHQGDVLTGAAVVELEPVRPEAVEDYLRHTTPQDDRLSRWEPVFLQLRESPVGPVAAALSTPLMTHLARSVYAISRAADPSELVDAQRFPTRQSVEDHLLDALVPAAFVDNEEQSGASGRLWKAPQVLRWLTFLAKRLHERGTRDFAWWDLPAPRGSIDIVGGTVVGLAAGGGFGVVFGFLLGLATGVGAAAGSLLGLFLRDGVVVALITGLLSWLAWLAFGRRARTSARFDRPPVRPLVRGFTVALVVTMTLALAAGLGVGFAAKLTSKLAVGPVFGLAVALTAGCALCLAAGLVTGRLSGLGWLVFGRPWHITVSFDRKLVGRLVRGLVVGLVFGLGVGLAFALVVWLAADLRGGFGVGLAVGLVFGLGGALGSLAKESMRPPSPISTLRADRAAAAFVGLIYVLGGVLVLGLAASLAVGLKGGLLAGLVTGPAWVLVGLVAAARHPWPRYQLVRAWFAAKGQVPWRLLAFLEEAHRLGVVRQVGASYQLSHARLQDRLARR